MCVCVYVKSSTAVNVGYVALRKQNAGSRKMHERVTCRSAPKAGERSLVIGCPQERNLRAAKCLRKVMAKANVIRIECGRDFNTAHGICHAVGLSRFAALAEAC